MIFSLEFNVDNAAFRSIDGKIVDEDEVARILDHVAAILRRGDLSGGKVLDINGNTVGQWGIIP